MFDLSLAQKARSMSIQNKIRIINRVEQIVSELKTKYPQSTPAFHELNKLSDELGKLTGYLSKLDQLQPNQTTNEIDQYMVSINLNLDILKGELENPDYVKLRNGVKVIKIALKFHPAKYSFFEFLVLWIYEFIYFI
jgi:hypothetical protein